MGGFYASLHAEKVCMHILACIAQQQSFRTDYEFQTDFDSRKHVLILWFEHAKGLDGCKTNWNILLNF
jgi:hypothetical protein